jgi:hypothetical protein
MQHQAQHTPASHWGAEARLPHELDHLERPFELPGMCGRAHDSHEMQYMQNADAVAGQLLALTIQS